MRSEVDKKSFLLKYKCHPFFEARLWWKAASRTRIFVSFVKSNQSVQKVSAAADWDERWEDSDHDDRDFMKRERRGCGGDGCYLCTYDSSNSTLKMQY